MAKFKKYVWLKSVGLLSLIILMLIGSSCRGRRHMTKYGPPSDYGYDEPVTKYGVPVDYEDGINEEDFTDTTSND